MTSLESLQRTVARVLLALAIALVPILTLTAWALHRPVGSTIAIAVILASAPIALTLLHRP
jgi:hypothetical protein